MRLLILTLLVLSVAHSGLGCGKKKKGKGGPANPGQQPVIPRKFGPATTAAYTPSGDNPGDCSQLKCNLDDSQSCAWTNAQPPADQLSWVTGTGQADPALLQKYFSTSTQPSGNYFITASETAGTSEQTAQLYSAPITCSQGDVTVNLKNWQTAGTRVEVCSETDPNGPPQNCQPAGTDSGNQHSIKIPKQDNQRIVILARGFTTPDGDIAIVDDIDVQCDACQSTTQPATPGPSSAPPAGAPPCKEIECDFESGSPCSYSPGSGGGSATENWGVHQVPYQNPLTGIRKDTPNPKKFGAAYTKKAGEKTTLSTQANFDQPYVVKYKLYKSVEGVTIKGCCDDENNCPQQIKKEADVADYKTWRSAALTCPANTKSVLFVCENLDGKSEGACGIDDIKLYQPTSGDPNDASQSACTGGSGGGSKRSQKKKSRT